MKHNYFPNGLPFSGDLAKNLDMQVKRVHEYDKASLILIDGQVGEGKTTFAIHVADYLKGAYEKQKDGTYKFNPKKAVVFEKQLGRGGEEFKNLLKTVYREKLLVCLYDEAGDFTNKRKLSRFNTFINMVFEQYRALKINVVLSMPFFDSLDDDIIKKGIVRMFIHLHGRSNVYGNYKAYTLKRLFYMKNNLKKMVDKRKVYSRTPNFTGCFYDLPTERSEQLRNYSITGKLGILEKGDITYQNLKTYREIAEQFDKSIRWVKNKVTKLKLSPTRFYRTKALYDEATIEKIRVTMTNERN